MMMQMDKMTTTTLFVHSADSVLYQGCLLFTGHLQIRLLFGRARREYILQDREVSYLSSLPQGTQL